MALADAVSHGVFVGVIAGVAGGILGPFLLAVLLPRKKCPDCGAMLTRLRNCWGLPGVVRRCRTWGCGVDLKGRKVEE